MNSKKRDDSIMSAARFLSVGLIMVVTASVGTAETVTFEGLLDTPETFYNGGPGFASTDPWVAGEVSFSNSFNTPFIGAWGGWGYSNTTDTTTPGFTNQYSAAPGGGSTGGAGKPADGESYALAFGSGTFTLPAGATIQSMDWTNGTYGLLSMQNGDGFAKQFGGITGDDPDFFRVTLSGWSGVEGSGATTGTVTLNLADYTSADNSQDYIVDTWQVDEDLTGLGSARSVSLSFESSDNGAFGMNTPAYFFMDNLQYSVTAVPEPGSALALTLLGAVAAVRRRR